MTGKNKVALAVELRVIVIVFGLFSRNDWIISIPSIAVKVTL